MNLVVADRKRFREWLEQPASQLTDHGAPCWRWGGAFGCQAMAASLRVSLPHRRDSDSPHRPSYPTTLQVGTDHLADCMV